MADKNTIHQKGKGHIAIQNSDVYITVSIYEEMRRLLSKSDFEGVANHLKYLMDLVGTKHPLYPHYKYKPVTFGNTTVFQHEPNHPDAHEKYPLSYQGKFQVVKKDNTEGKNLSQIIDDAYFNQEEVEIDMKSLTTWLGDKEMETPNLDQTLTEGKWLIVPEKLPEPLKLKFYLKDEQDVSIIDYLEMSISGKEKNDFILLDNKNQNTEKLLVTLKIPIKQKNKGEHDESRKTIINVGIKPEFESEVESSRALLSFLKLLSKKSGTLNFKNLTNKKDLMVANKFNYNGNIYDLEKDLIFIERLHKIESYYNVKFTIPEKLDKSDWEAIDILEKTKENKPIIYNLKKLTLTFNNTSDINRLIQIFEKKKTEKDEPATEINFVHSLSDGSLELFDTVIRIKKTETTYSSLKMMNIERIKQKVSLMDEGETLKVILDPGHDPSYSVSYFIEIIEQN